MDSEELNQEKRERKQEQITMDSEELNQDILMEILSRSTYETTVRCNLLCKNLKHLITHDTYFRNLHSQRTNTFQGCFVQSSNRAFVFVSTGSNNNPKPDLTLDFLPYINPRIVSCDSNTGIMLCYRSRPGCNGHPLYIICKPSTKQWWGERGPEIQPSTLATEIYVLGTKPLRFKIIRLSWRQPQKGYCVQGRCFCLHWEVFDSNSYWRILTLPDITHRILLSCYNAISYCGMLNWLTVDGYVISFCVETESIELIYVPEEVLRETHGPIHDTYVKLVKYKGKLGLIHRTDGISCIDLWVLEDYEDQFWVLKHKIDVGSAIGSNRCSFFDVVWPIAFWKLDESPFKLFMFDCEKNEMDSVDNCVSEVVRIFSLCSDMEKVDQLMDRAEHRSMYLSIFD